METETVQNEEETIEITSNNDENEVEEAQRVEVINAVPETFSGYERREIRRKRSVRKGFFNGLAVGVGIGCIATFIILWTAIYFTPKLPTAITYENLLSIFIYPLLYLLTIGLVFLTAGLVKEKYSSSG